MKISCEAPGRVNLLGEHTDYTGGFVLPIAIPFTTRADLQPQAGSAFVFRSTLFPGSRIMSPSDRSPALGDWSDYPVGVLRQLQARGIAVPPFLLELSGNVPLGAGLSSSASVEVATAMALLQHTRIPMSAAEIATLCRAAENDFVGSPCGIMDQFVITAARRDHALLLNTRTLTFELLPLNTGELAGCRIIIINSMIRHSIAEGDYGLRRQEVEAGQRALLSIFPQLQDLAGATLGQLEQARPTMSPESFLRCRHIITENQRVARGRRSMLAGDAAGFGQVMTGSHRSQRDDFQCSIPEIDFLVDTAIAIPGCLGARLTGGGFGGCIVGLVRASAAEAFQNNLLEAYLSRFSLPAEAYICEAGDGAMHRAELSESMQEDL